VEDYQADRSTKWLQRTYGLSQVAALRLLNVNRILRQQSGLSAEQIQDAIQPYGQGRSLTRIGNHASKDHTVVRNALVRRAVPLRKHR
jgi:hypothetical protein